MSELLHGRSTKEFQDFFTPPDVATEFVSHLLASMPTDKVTTVLDPAVGSGALVWPLLSGGKPVKVYCIDIQQDYIQYVAEEAKRRGYTVTKEPFGIAISNT